MSDHKEKLSREEIARREIGHTDIPRRRAWIFSLIFLGMIGLYPLFQGGYELICGRADSAGDLSMLRIFRLGREAIQKANARRADNPVRWVGQRSGELKKAIAEYENILDEASFLRARLLPGAQSVMLGLFRTGSEKAIAGRDGWLFFAGDYDYLNHPGFLRPGVMAKRALKQAGGIDPVPAIVDFRDRLKARGIELIVMPVPVKVSLYAGALGAPVKPGAVLRNASFAAFRKRLDAAGIRVFDPAPTLAAMCREGERSYLKTDTHWTPEAMERVASELASQVAPLLERRPKHRFHAVKRDYTEWGDIARMFKVRDLERLIPRERVQVTETDVPFDRGSDLLLLGDSFCNIYSLPAMGWGSRGGFAEHLGRALGRAPDAILRNDAGSYATRELLANELRRGRDRLAGKKVVVWEFAERELVSGNWKMLSLELGKAPEQKFIALRPGEKRSVTGVVLAVSELPVPGSAPYKDHVMALHLADVDGRPGLEALVYIQSMSDNRLTPAAALRPGMSAKFVLRAWSDVEAERGSLKRSEFDDEELMLQEPVWGNLEP